MERDEDDFAEIPREEGDQPTAEEEEFKTPVAEDEEGKPQGPSVGDAFRSGS